MNVMHCRTTTCGSCDGYGQVCDYGNGNDFYGAKECRVCSGSGLVLARDNLGRFLGRDNDFK